MARARDPETGLWLKAGEEAPAPDRSAREPRDETREETGRKKRVPLGVATAKLNGKVPKGMVGRHFNDTPGRIAAALEAGYVFVNDDSETTGSKESARVDRVGVGDDGRPLMGILMAIPAEYYEEDQAAKQVPVDEIDAVIKRGTPQGAEAQDQGAFYNAGISMSRD